MIHQYESRLPMLHVLRATLRERMHWARNTVLRHARCAVLTVPARTRATDIPWQSMPVREDENEPATALISPAPLKGVDDMSTRSAEEP